MYKKCGIDNLNQNLPCVYTIANIAKSMQNAKSNFNIFEQLYVNYCFLAKQIEMYDNSIWLNAYKAT